MKTLAHKPAVLHSQVVTFSHELTPIRPKALPSTIAPFDYERCMREFFAQKEVWASFPRKAYMMQGRPSVREVALWLALEGDERRYSYPYPDNDYFLQTYPAAAFEQELDQEALLQALIPVLKTRLDDGRVISIVELLQPHLPLNTLVDTLLAHVDMSLCGTMLIYVKQLDPALAIKASEQLLLAMEELNAWERPLAELQVCVIREDIKGLIAWFERGHHLAFSARTLAMEALGLIKDWETFRRIAYEQLENYSPVALRAHLESFGELGLQEAMNKIKETWSSTWGGVFQIHHPAVAELALWVLHALRNRDSLGRDLWLEAQRWLHREGANAIVGALRLWEDEALSQGAQALLKDYIWRGHGELVLSLAQAHAPQHLEALEEWAQASPAPDATLPDGCQALEYWFKRGMRHPIPDGIMPPFPILTVNGQPLSLAQVEGLLRLLQDQDRARAKDALKALEHALDADARHKLAEHLVMTWLRADAIPRLEWCLQSCGPLCAEGMERIYVRIKAQLIKQWRPIYWHWRFKSRLTDIWTKLIEVIIKNDTPTRMALLINELSAPPFYPERGKPWVAPTEALTSEGEHDARSRLDSFEDAILACQLSQPELAQLYFHGLDQLHATWEVPQWRRLATEMARADLRTRTLWMLERGEQEDALIFRLDLDGSLLDDQDQEVSLTPSTGRISRVGLEQLSPLERAAWEQTMSEHELVLYVPPNYKDDDDDDDEEE